MNSDDKLKEIGVKNHTCYYFADIAIINDIDFHNILLDWKCCRQKSVWCKAFSIIFDAVDGYIRKYDETKYLALFHFNEKYERIFERISYLIKLKNNISDVYSYRFSKTKFILDDHLPSEKHIKYA